MLSITLRKDLGFTELKTPSIGGPWSGPPVFIAVAMNTDGFFSYQCMRFIFSMNRAPNFFYDRAGTV